MRVLISGRKLKRLIEDDSERKKRFGIEMAKKINIRMAALFAAESMATFWPPYSGPERCHELKGALSGQFSMDLKQPYRLLFRPVDVPSSFRDIDEKRRWGAIDTIEVLSIEDTHG
jgi:plasmid maintenance system killer protein